VERGGDSSVCIISFWGGVKLDDVFLREKKSFRMVVYFYRSVTRRGGEEGSSHHFLEDRCVLTSLSREREGKRKGERGKKQRRLSTF